MGNQEKCRASFEAYVLSKTADDHSMLLRVDAPGDIRHGEYVNENWQRTWLGWRAAWEEFVAPQNDDERMFTNWEGRWRGCSGWRFSALKPNGIRTCVFEVYQGLEKAEVQALLKQLNGPGKTQGQ